MPPPSSPASRRPASASPARHRRRGGRVGRLLAAVVVLVGGAGCRVDAAVTVDVDGASGTVRARMVLDREAVALLGGFDRVAGGAQVADLRRAGWEIPAPRATDDGGAVVGAAKGFDHPRDLEAVVAELSGPSGPLRSFRLRRDRGWASTRYRLEGEATLGPETAGLGNAPGLRARLADAGVDPDRLAALLSGRAAEGFSLRVVIDLPGEERALGAEGHPPAWDVPPGGRVAVAARSSAADLRRPALLLVAVGLGGAAVVVARAARRPGPGGPGAGGEGDAALPG